MPRSFRPGEARRSQGSRREELRKRMTLFALALVLGIAGVARGQTFTEFPLPTGFGPHGITSGPDGNVWFTVQTAPFLSGQIGRITTVGVSTEFPLPTPNTQPLGITAGPDGNLWFCDNENPLTGERAWIGRITTAGVITEFPLADDSGPTDIAAGPDGKLWFTESNANLIGRITTAAVITEFPIPTPFASPSGIAGGPDGNLWFTESNANQIGRITPAGVVTEFPIPTAGSAPRGIAGGFDGNLWFVEFNGNQIGRITTSGSVTEFPIPTAGSVPIDIAAGSDGNLWFTEQNGNRIGRITTAGVITEFSIPTGGSFPSGITGGPDGNLWFAESQGHQIGRLTTVGGGTPTALSVDPGGNGILEANEPLPVAVEPTWRNDSAVTLNLTGASSNFTGPGGPTYDNPDTTADYGTLAIGDSAKCTDCYSVQITAATRPAQHWDATLDETLAFSLAGGAPPSKTWTLHVGESFTDVLATDLFYPSIETIFHHGVTAGCGDGTTYCPLQNNQRQEMAVFLLKSLLGSSYVPPPCAGIFSDVVCTPGVGFPDWLEDLYYRGITAGCQPNPEDQLAFCPTRDISRQEMAVFLLRTLLGESYDSPDCAGIFADVPCTPGAGFSDWIEDLYNHGITAGCQLSGDPLAFCPANPVTRQEMAAFLKTTFSLVLYGP